jgi:hypothetical protein
MSAGTRDHRRSRFEPTLNSMNERGSQLLEIHLRSLDPAEPTARERLEEAMGESLARKLVFALALRLAN